MDIVKPKLHQQGFSYLEILVAMLLFSVAAMALAHISLGQAKVTQMLSSQLASQQLLLTIQNRLALNTDYIKQWQGKSLYFAARPLQPDCKVEQLSLCSDRFCSGELLAQQDLLELDCLAKETGARYRIAPGAMLAVGNVIEVLLSIWLSSDSSEMSDSNVSNYKILL